jgi:hypothetical protein
MGVVLAVSFFWPCKANPEMPVKGDPSKLLVKNNQLDVQERG